MQPYPPLQTLIAAACLRADGFEVALFDSTFEPPEEGFRKALATTPASAGRHLRGQFQLPDQDVPHPQSRAGLLHVPGRTGSGRARGGEQLRCLRPRLRLSRAWGGFRSAGRSGVDLARPCPGVAAREVASEVHRRAGVSRPRAQSARQPATRIDGRSRSSFFSSVGPGGCERVSRGMEARARIFFAEHGFQPRLPVPVQLVREADLWEQLSRPLARSWWRRKCIASRLRCSRTTSGSPTTFSRCPDAGRGSSPKRWKRSTRAFRSRCNPAAT